jgi:hypothetical protein
MPWPISTSTNEKGNLMTEPDQEFIGYIVGGGLKENLRVRLTLPPQKVQEGAFVVIESGDWQFYGLTTDLQLGSTDPRFADEQSEQRLPVDLASLLHGQTLYTNLEVLPALMRERGPDPASPDYPAWRDAHQDDPQLLPIKTIPSHHAPVRLASAADVADIFGKPEKKENFPIGTTREQDHPVCLNLEKFVQRSSGIFGATGSGKSFLTRIILSGLIHYDKTSTLILDMHNEYGLDDTSTDTNQRVVGLKTKFPTKVRLVGLGVEGTIRKQIPDFHLEIAEDDIHTADIAMLASELNLRETTATTLEVLYQTFQDNWFHEFKSMKNGTEIEIEKDGKKIRVPAPDSVAAWADKVGANSMAAEGLRNKMGRVFNLSYIVEKPAANGLDEIIKCLEAGMHVVLSFGDHETDLDYLLVSNLLTRRIRETWERKTNQFRSGKGSEPRPLVIVVEEAHKLLNREMAAQTAFASIAREMRKYYVTLLIIDQRPSQIYDEVMSQLGTRVSGWLGDEDDIHAVLAGLAGRDALRGMLAHLQLKEEVLLLGWGVPMPIMIRSRRYDDKFWEELMGKKGTVKSESQLKKELGF